MRLIKLKEVMECTALSRASIYRLMAQDDFPKSVSLGERSVAWVESEVHEWVLVRIGMRDSEMSNTYV